MKTLAPFILFVVAFGIMGSCQKDSPSTVQLPALPQQLPYLRGIDLSFHPQLQQTDLQYLDSSNQNVLGDQLFLQNEWNIVRLRLWVNPLNDHSGFGEVQQYCKQLRNQGAFIWLALHYSDHWADPGQQKLPIAWQALDRATLLDTVASYTHRVVSAIAPDVVQIGNEINAGMLWPMGSLDSMGNFLTLLDTALKSAHSARPEAIRMIHLAGADAATQWMFSQIKAANLPYEWVGISYYPWWHGKDLQLLQNQLLQIHQITQKPIGIAETAYPFSLQWGDWTHNVVGLPEQLIPTFPASPEGQRDFLVQLDHICKQLPQSWGWAYWAPDWVAVNDTQSVGGSSWENLALFNFEHQALPAIYLPPTL